ncbi:uncharacterized protein LOC119687569 [Teleopsis dalmanni]|uniref:uncharacterized protein LOC119687569 n=1 Tax=Teleopsis dalmanni TaxID=139649 RepID=UPI0018CF1CE1|nr:uncharacterized protein LOC119687569 [Teleopsis dalmanni]
MANTERLPQNESSEKKTVTLFSIQYNIEDLDSFKLSVNIEEFYKYITALLNDEKRSKNFDATSISRLLAEQISKFNSVANSIFKDKTLLNNPKSVPKSVPTAANNPTKVNCSKKRKVEKMQNPIKKKKENGKCKEVQHVLNANTMEEEFDHRNIQYVSNPSTAEEELKAKKVQMEFQDQDGQRTLNPNRLEELKDMEKCAGTASDKQNEEHNKPQSEQCENAFSELQEKIFHCFDEFETNLLGIQQKLKRSTLWIKAYECELEERRSNYEEWYNNYILKLPLKNKHNDGGVEGSKPQK